MIKVLTRGVIIAVTAVMLLLPFNKVNAGIPVGTWRSHPAYNNATQAVKAFGLIFVLSEGAIYFYDPADEGLYTIDKTGGLGDTDIATICYCKPQNAVLLVYSNGNIDIIYSDETIYNFTDLKNNNIGSVSVNEVKINENIAYISTSIGLVLFDVKQREIKNTYRFDAAVNTSVIMGDSLFCGTDAGIYLGNTKDNLLDKSKWKMFCDIKFMDLFEFDGKLSGRSYYNRLWTINKANASLTNILNKVTAISFNQDKLALIQDSVVTLYSSYTDYVEYHFNSHINHLMIDNDDWWVSQGVDGLCRYTLNDESIVCKAQGIKPNSPRRNWFHSVSWPEKGRLLVVGGYHNYLGIDYPGTLMIYENGRWTSLDEDIPSKTGHKYINLTEAVQDPADRNHIFVGSTGQGLYEFRDNKFEKLYTWDNSGLTSILDEYKYDYVRISALQYDKDGNLWMANNETDTVIKVLEPNGKWFGLYYSEIAGLPTLKQMRFDSDGRIWLNSSRGKPGIICIDINNTPKNNSDDKIRFSGSFWVNQDGTKEEIYDIFCYEFDLNGQMWIGTNRGIFVLKTPEKFITESNPVFERIKIPRNDGSDLADYLLNGVYTTAIYVDQGNRKWIGTRDDGVFLMSEDGTETLEHFTVSNSPLPSNNILSITENGLDGSVFFGTSLGMIEYGGTARDPEESLSESNILVYPNPVKPDFDGFVTVTGLTERSTVKIIANSGRLIHQGISNGGSYSWNFTDMNGNPVPSGVYHAIITNLENNRSESASVTVIR
ncbi:MAG: hypothetical protein J6P66_11010 [Bacteroidaceae bacterium]|nr:hypothetical protein [Bacteroidaceae bacterium]MBO7111063.1 hypothetical protein [Bacteroidaceae bacterium]